MYPRLSDLINDLFGTDIALPIQSYGFFLAMAFVGAGLFCVWLEIGRPWRFLNVFRHPARSWMTREAIIAIVLFILVMVFLLG